jgi:hypothetical protein
MRPYIIFIIIIIILFGLLIFDNFLKNFNNSNNSDNLDNSNNSDNSNKGILKYINIFNKNNDKSRELEKSRKLDKIDLSKENYTEYMYRKLIKYLSEFDKDKKTLDGKCKESKYIWNTTDKFIKDDMNQITKIVIENINKQPLFDFNYTGYGDIIIKEDKKGNQQFQYELFVLDKKHYFQIKLYVDLIKYVRNDYVKESENNKNLVFPYYNIGIPSKEQLIPTPMNVIPTGNEVISTSGINYPIPSPIQYLYINKIAIENSTLVINPKSKINNKETCGGYSDGSENFSFVQNDNDPYIEPAVIRNKWGVLPDQPPNINTWPCTPKPNFWDKLGIYEPEIHDTLDCPGETWAAQYVYPQPNYNPTLATLPRNCGENYWLFDQTNGSGASSSSASQPPP